MANNNNKPSSDGKLRDSELLGWLFGFLFFAIIVGGIFQALQGSLGEFGDDGMGIGAIVAADGVVDVWELPGAGEILGTQTHHYKRGARPVHLCRKYRPQNPND